MISTFMPSSVSNGYIFVDVGVSILEVLFSSLFLVCPFEYSSVWLLRLCGRSSFIYQQIFWELNEVGNMGFTERI